MDTTTKPSVALRDQAQAAAMLAAHAGLNAIGAAAANAAKKGGASSEFKATIFGFLIAGGVAALHALSVIPGPWTVPAVALSAGIAAGSYALSRGNVKVAALQAAGAAAASLLPNQAAALQAAVPLAGAALGVVPDAGVTGASQ